MSNLLQICKAHNRSSHVNYYLPANSKTENLMKEQPISRMYLPKISELKFTVWTQIWQSNNMESYQTAVMNLYLSENASG